MAHVRKQIRDAVGALLSAAPVNWQRVFKTRIAPARDVAPYLLVFLGAETEQPLDIGDNYLMQRDISLSVRGHLRIIEGEALEDAMDAMAAEIETTLTVASLRGALPKLKQLYLVASDSDMIEEENERAYAEISLEWQVQIHTYEGQPETLV